MTIRSQQFYFPTKFNGMGLSEANIVYTLFKQFFWERNEKTHSFFLWPYSLGKACWLK
jgi:hypothetical protein